VVEDWYRHAVSHAEAQAPRVDRYLRPAAGGGLGAKLREGKLELKQRVKAYGLQPLGSAAVGKIELWRKWVFDLADAGAEAASLRSTADWIAVEKARQLGRFTPGAGDRLARVPLAPLLPAACDCELTQVRLASDEVWWTLGFEAFSDAGDALSLLLATARLLLAPVDDLPLPAHASAGYAAWLALHAP
jgi:hypothetical protein